MTCRERLESYLRKNRIPYGVHPHPPAYTAQAVAEQEHIPNQLMVKVVIIVADGELAMLVVPASRRVDLAAVAALLDAREVRLATEHELAAAFPDCQLGAMPPFGELYEMPVYADRSLEGDRAIFFQAGDHTLAFSVAYADFKRLAEPALGIFTQTQRLPAHVPLVDLHETGGW